MRFGAASDDPTPKFARRWGFERKCTGIRGRPVPVAEQAIWNVKFQVDRERIDGVLTVLGVVPGIGRLYDPLYEAAKPPEEVTVAYAGHYGIYYEVLERERRVHVYYLEDQRCDPMSRFGSA